MAVSVLDEAHQYLYRYGTITDTTIDPVDLVRDLVGECERLTSQLNKKPPASKKSSRKK